MSAVARLSAVAGDDISIVVVLPAGFTTGKTFALQLRRRNGALVHTATPTVAGDNVLIEIDAETSAAFHAGWLYGHLQVATPTVVTLFRLDLLVEADLTGGTGPVGALPTTPSVSTVSCIIDDTPIDVTVYSALNLGGVHADLTGRTAADSHPQSAITGLTSALAEKLSAASNLSDLTDVAAAIDNLGLVGPNQPHGYAELNGAGTLPDVLVPASIARDSEVTAAIEAAQYTDEQVRDVVASALVAGSNITITVDDVANTITIGSTGPVPVTAISTSDVSKTSNVTPAAHAQLKVECAANGLYLIRANIHYGGAQTGMVALGFSGPTGAATVGGMSALGIPGGSSNSPQYAYVGTGTTTFGLGQTAIFGGPGNSGGVDRRAHAIIEAVVQMSSTAGDISVIWAQGASNVIASTVFAGSTLTVTKIG